MHDKSSLNGEGYSVLKNDIEVQEILYEYILNALSDEELTVFFGNELELNESYKSNIPRLAHPFIISFTYNKDDRFLWDSYTNNQGVCLEFSLIELRSYLQKKYYPVRCIMEDVKYDEKEQVEFILKCIENDVTNLFGKFGQSEWMGRFAALCKNPFWKPENEVRAVVFSKYFSDAHFEVKENYDLKYKNDYKTQDYIEVSIPKSLIKGITLGPLNPENKSEEYVDSIRSRLGNDTIPIESSNGTGIIRK